MIPGKSIEKRQIQGPTQKLGAESVGYMATQAYSCGVAQVRTKAKSFKLRATPEQKVVQSS